MDIELIVLPAVSFSVILIPLVVKDPLALVMLAVNLIILGGLRTVPNFIFSEEPMTLKIAVKYYAASTGTLLLVNKLISLILKLLLQ